MIFDHHETLLKNLDKWKNLDTQNTTLFYSAIHSASWIFFNFLKRFIIDLESALDKNFFFDLTQKIHFIDLNDTTVVEDEKICQFIEYCTKQNYHIITNNPLVLS